VLSEGIVQLMQRLRKYEEFTLNVLIAVRLDMEDSMETHAFISESEYTIRLQEKLILAFARRFMGNNKKQKYTISFDSARKNKGLMLADIVCNTWLTQNSRKFNDEQRVTIKSLYSDSYHFSVIENSFTTLLERGELSAAVFDLCVADDVSLSLFNKNIDRIFKRWPLLNSDAQKMHFQILNAKINALILIDRNFTKAKRLLTRLQDTFLPSITGTQPTFFNLDVCLHLCTIYTHEGDLLKAEQQFEIFNNTFKLLPKLWQNMDYYFIAKIRNAVHRSNAFDFEGAVDEASLVIRVLTETSDWLLEVDELHDMFVQIKNDTLGKAYGARLQNFSFMIRKNRDFYYPLAIADSEHAMNEFVSEADISRQCQYRSQIECEALNFDDSLKWLMKAVNIEDSQSEAAIKKILTLIAEKPFANIYIIMHYTRILAEAAIQGATKTAGTLYNYLSRETKLIQFIKSLNSEDFPANIILWKMAAYNSVNESYNTAAEYYKKAINICFIRPERKTLVAIGLGILAEKASFFIKAGQQRHKNIYRDGVSSIKDLSNRYKAFMQSDIPEYTQKYFASWEAEISHIESENNIEQKSTRLFALSRSVPY
jgi:tetratricopeptide (TPR) repeat protein